MNDFEEALHFTSQPMISVYVMGGVNPVSAASFEIGDAVPLEVQIYLLECEDDAEFPYKYADNYDLVFDELPSNLSDYLTKCLATACAVSGGVVWLGFEGSFHFDNILTDVVALQIYGVCAPGGEPRVTTDPDERDISAWRSVVRSHREELAKLKIS